LQEAQLALGTQHLISPTSSRIWTRHASCGAVWIKDDPVTWTLWPARPPRWSAHDVTEVNNWFTQGSDTADL